MAATACNTDGDRAAMSDQADITKVLVAEDHPVTRMGAVSLLAAEADIEVVGEVATCLECCEQAVALKPDVVILDLEMGDCRGTQALARLLDACPSAAVVVYSTHDGDLLVREVIQAGASGFVPKIASPTRLVDAVRAVSCGQCYLDASVTSAVMGTLVGGTSTGRGYIEPLTEREKAVLVLLAQGKRNRDISRALFIAERTVKFHVSGLMQKLDASNRTELLKNAIDQGLIGT